MIQYWISFSEVLKESLKCITHAQSWYPKLPEIVKFADILSVSNFEKDEYLMKAKTSLRNLQTSVGELLGWELIDSKQKWHLLEHFLNTVKEDYYKYKIECHWFQQK